MKARIETHWGEVSIDLSAPIDISIPFDPAGGASAWYVDNVKIWPVMEHGFVGSVQQGGAVNFRHVQLNPHGNGTHTECLGHITNEVYSIHERIQRTFFTCCLVTIEPAEAGSDRVIQRSHIEEQMPEDPPEALVIRTLPNDESKRTMNYSSTNPPYLEPEAIQFIRNCGIRHLLIDLPSVDREEDEGKLAGHHVFWNVPEDPDHERAITELIYAPNEISDGRYMLDLHVAPLQNDAAPSKPLLYQI